VSFVIRGVGTCVPEGSILQTEAAELAVSFAGPEGGRERTLRALFRKSGLKKRHSVILETATGELKARQSFYPPALGPDDKGPSTAVRMARYEAEAPPLAAEASRRALSDAGMEPAEITHLVTVSCTGFFAPGLDAKLLELLDLSRGVERTHVGFMGCHGAMNGIRTGASHTGANPEAKVLICALELCSLHLAYGWDPNDLVANAIFGDGAAAVVGTSPSAAGRSDDWTVVSNGTYLLPNSGDAMSWRIGDHGFQMTLSPRVPDLIRTHLEGWLRGWLAGNGLSLEEVEAWAVHPGGPRILNSVEEALGLERSATSVPRAVLSEFGNMSSATILFILERMRAADAPRPLVALAFGPGLVVEAVLIR
jgi:predicted naringenin-chalcone synthase